ncbi:MAG: PilZ domain-containing protein [Desulfobulbaceae bacterium]
MNLELRGAKRYNDFIPVFVTAQNGTNGSRIAGPFSGRIINFSRSGACLLMSLGVLDSYNVYSSTVRDASSFLEIKGRISSAEEQFKFTARPVWTDPFIMEELCAFKMGIEFLINPEGEQMNTFFACIAGQNDG